MKTEPSSPDLPPGGDAKSPSRWTLALEAMRGVPAKFWIRLGILVTLLALGFVLVLWTPVGDYFTEERVTAFLEEIRESPWAPLLMILGYVVIAPFGIPASPLLIAVGIVYGPVLGSIYNVVGLVVAAMTTFYVARALGRDFVVQLAGDRLKRAERVFERQGFWPLVHVRFLPIPFSLISYGAAVAGVKAPLFLITSTLGLIPATVIHTYFAPELITDPDPLTGLFYLGALVLMNVLAGWQSLRERWRRRRRYHQLLEERRQRSERRSGG